MVAGEDAMNAKDQDNSVVVVDAIMLGQVREELWYWVLHHEGDRYRPTSDRFCLLSSWYRNNISRVWG